LENKQAAQNSISRLNLVLTGSGLFLFLLGSYLSLGVSRALLNTGQYFFIVGIALSCVAMFSIFRKQDF